MYSRPSHDAGRSEEVELNGLPAPACPDQLRIVSLNCWGLKFISKHRHARLVEIGNQLAIADPRPDIVALQECWTQQDYQAIRARTKHILPYAKYYFSGIFGGGLAIMSRWPIMESSMVQYPLNGRPTAFFRGDWFVGKGVACARIKIGPGLKDVVEVFCTHLHAPYEREPNDSYICHRTAQAWEIAKLMRGAAERGHLVLGMGDFNMIPLSLAHRLIETYSPVRDVWRIVHPDSSVGAAEDSAEIARGRPQPSVAYNIAQNGTTCDSVRNTWRWNKGQQQLLDKGTDIYVDDDALDPRGKRLDYIFFGAGLSKSQKIWTVDNVNVGMIQRHPELKCSLSDHFAVEATLSVRHDHQITPNGNGVNAPHSADDDCAPTRARTEDPSVFQAHLPASTFDEILAMIVKYRLRERQQRRFRLYHFGGALAVTIGCLLAVWWSPHNGVAFVLMLLSSLGLSAGVIDGLIGGLFVSAELRALKEFEWEVLNLRMLAVAAPSLPEDKFGSGGVGRGKDMKGGFRAEGVVAGFE